MRQPYLQEQTQSPGHCHFDWMIFYSWQEQVASKLSASFCFCFLRQDLTEARVALNSPHSCHHLLSLLLSPGITGMCHHTWLLMLCFWMREWVMIDCWALWLMSAISLAKNVTSFFLTKNITGMWATVTLLNGHLQVLSCVPQWWACVQKNVLQRFCHNVNTLP